MTLIYPVYQARRRIEKIEFQQMSYLNENEKNVECLSINKIPKSLESFLSNWLVLMVLLIGLYTLTKQNRLVIYRVTFT